MDRQTEAFNATLKSFGTSVAFVSGSATLFAWGAGEECVVVSAEEWVGPGPQTDEDAFVEQFTTVRPRFLVDRKKFGIVWYDSGPDAMEAVGEDHPVFSASKTAMIAVMLLHRKAAEHWPDWKGHLDQVRPEFVPHPVKVGEA